jgi:hypothetical protein
LMELHMTSNNASAVNGQEVGQALADLFLLQHSKNTIKMLTLKFGRTWETAGATAASILLLNPGINSLSVELTGKEATSVQAKAIFKALRSNSHLRRLTLCLDRDMHLDQPLEESFHQALQKLLLEHNHVLQSVAVLDEHREKYPLGSTVACKLLLNASGLPALLHGTAATASPEQQERDYIKVMIDSKDSLDLVFYALINQPCLLLDACVNKTAFSKGSLIDTDSESDDESTSYWGKAIFKRKPATSMAKQKLMGLFHVYN